MHLMPDKLGNLAVHDAVHSGAEAWHERQLMCAQNAHAQNVKTASPQETEGGTYELLPSG